MHMMRVMGPDSLFAYWIDWFSTTAIFGMLKLESACLRLAAKWTASSAYRAVSTSATARCVKSSPRSPAHGDNRVQLIRRRIR